MAYPFDLYLHMAPQYINEFTVYLSQVPNFQALTPTEQEQIPLLLAAAKTFEAQCVRLNITPPGVK